MKFTLSWLKTHLETEAPLDVIVETLTKIGLEVEHVDNPAEQLAAFRIAEILEAAPHPNADRLRVCQVSTGEGAALQVVCGAPNARAGLKTVFAAPGTYIPAKNITIAKGVIRGVEFGGMMCSPEELGLDGDSSGIFELAGRRPGRRRLRGLGGPRRPADRNQPHAQSLRRGEPVRHRARSRRRRAWKTHRAAHCGGRRRIRLPGRSQTRFCARGRASRAAVRPSSCARREEWSEPRMAAKPAEKHRPAADQRAGGHHQFPDF